MARIEAKTFELKYLAAMDRLILTVDLSATHQFGMLLTRRLARNFLAALAKSIGTQPLGTENPGLKDVILNNEHSRLVTKAKTDGTIRKKKSEKQLVADAGLAREIKISGATAEFALLDFTDGENVLAIQMPSAHLHIALEIFLQVSKEAEWDFPPISVWLERSASSEPKPAPRTLN